MEDVSFFIRNFAGIIESLVVGILCFILCCIVLPDSWLIKLFKIFKRNIIDSIKRPFYVFIERITGLFVYKNNLSFDNNQQGFNEKIKYLLTENEKIEKNLYAIDLCSDLFEMLSYMAGNQDYDVMVEDAITYINAYLHAFVEIDQDEEFIYNVDKELGDVTTKISRERLSDDDIREITYNASSKLRDNKKQLNNILDKNKKEIIELIKTETNAK